MTSEFCCSVCSVILPVDVCILKHGYKYTLSNCNFTNVQMALKAALYYLIRKGLVDFSHEITWAWALSGGGALFSSTNRSVDSLCVF